MKYKLSQLMFKKYVDYHYQLPEYNPAADFNWIQSQSGLPWLKLDIDTPYQIILNEINSIRSLLVEHRDDYEENQGW